MKKAYILLAVACGITVFSCTKNHSTYTTVDGRDTTGFVVGGVSDLQIESRDSVMFPITVDWVSGDQNKLTFSASGLPANVTAKFSPESGYSNFTTMLTLVSKKAALGSYPVKIMVTDANGAVVRTYDVKLTVGPKMICADEISGQYFADYACTSDSADSVSMNVIPMSMTANDNSVMITNLGQQQFNINAKLACEGQQITIPYQKFGAMYEVWGSGDFATDSTIKLSYTVVNSAIADTSSCSATLKRKP